MMEVDEELERLRNELAAKELALAALQPAPPPAPTVQVDPEQLEIETAPEAEEIELEIDGITFKVRADIMEDWEIVEFFAEAADKPDELTPVQLIEFFRIIYGEYYQHVKNELRKANGGKLTAETMGDFLNATVEQLNARDDRPKE